jgi:hypothetical protein
MRGSGIAGCAAAIRRAAMALLGGVFAAATVVASSWAAWAQVSQQTSPDPQALATQAIRRLGLQTELIREPEPLGLNLNLPPEVLYLAVIIGLAILLYAFRDMIPVLRAGRGGAWADGDELGVASGPRAPEIVLGADELAAQGRFVEAMHVLLLQALAEIRRRLDEQFADSFTSREILRSKALSDELRRPLRDVVNRVEWSYFGEHPAARDDYLACRMSFNALAQVLHRNAPA